MLVQLKAANFFQNPFLRFILFGFLLFSTEGRGQTKAASERPAFSRNNGSLVYHGKLVRPDGKALNSSMVVEVKIQSPEPGLCLLWAEKQTVTVKNGSFALELGYEANRIAGSLGGVVGSFREAFVNKPGMEFSGAQCASGTSFTPSSNDDRLLSASFKNAFVVIEVDEIPIKSVPFALQASEISGYGIDHLVKISGAGNSLVFAPAEIDSLKQATQLGTPNQLLGVNSNGTALEYKSLTAGTGIALSQTPGGLQINAVGGTGLGSVTDVTVSGLPLSVSNGSSTPHLSIAQATATSSGYLSSADWIAFNSKPSSASPAIGANSVGSTEVIDGALVPADLNFLGSMATNTGLLIRNTAGFFNKSCSGNEALVWSVANGWSCSSVVLSEIDPKVGANSLNVLSKWNGTALVASGIHEVGGNVGIGTASPGARLDVAGAVRMGGTNYVTLYHDGSNHRIENVGSGNLLLNYDNGKRLDIGSLATKVPFVVNGGDIFASTTGYVGIGTTSPSRRMEIAGPIRIRPESLPGAPGAGDLAIDSADSNKLKWHDGTGWQTAGGGSGSGDFLASGTVPMTGNFRLSGNYLSNDGDSEGLRVSNNGNVAIGATSPTSRLLISRNTAQPSISFNNALLNVVGGDSEFAIINTDSYASEPLFIQRRANGTLSAPSAVQAYQNILQVLGYGYGTSAFSASSRVAMIGSAQEDWTNSAHGSMLSFWTTPNGSTSMAERVRIHNTGDVSIGQLGYEGRLTVNSGNSTTPSETAVFTRENYFTRLINRTISNNLYESPIFMAVRSRGTAAAPTYLQNGDQMGALIFRDHVNSVGASMYAFATENHSASAAGSEIRFSVAANGSIVENQAMVIANNGRVGIGVGVPDDKFVVSNGSTTGRYTSSGWTHSSDLRMKKDVTKIESSLAKILLLRGVGYQFTADPEGRRELGFIAQEVEPIFPEVVRTDESGYKSMIYANLIAPIVEAIKVLYEDMVELRGSLGHHEIRIAELEKENQSLRTQLTKQAEQLNEHSETLREIQEKLQNR